MSFSHSSSFPFFLRSTATASGERMIVASGLMLSLTLEVLLPRRVEQEEEMLDRYTELCACVGSLYSDCGEFTASGHRSMRLNPSLWRCTAHSVSLKADLVSAIEHRNSHTPFFSRSVSFGDYFSFVFKSLFSFK